MKSLYFDCFAGASGNMILGGLVALGIDENELIEQIKLLDISDFEIEFTTANKSGISAIHANVKVPHEHAHRHLHHIEKIINESRLSQSIKERAIKIFTRLAEAEAKIHGIEVKKVHFHEVGAMDAIIDVVGACIGFEMLGIERFACSKIHVGSGFAKMAHGKFPIPPPAVAELLQGIPIYSTEITGELCTPTGAAIISTLCDSYGEINDLNIEKIGYGAGTREYKDFPNAIRLMFGTRDQGQETREEKCSEHRPRTTNHLILLETNLDDTTGQVLGYVMDKAFESGALDCWFTPIQMKKNRPATMISILCENKNRQKLTELLYIETTTLGVRVREVERECLERKFVKVETQFGEIDVKIGLLNGKQVNAMPEFDQLKKVAVENNIPLKELKEIVLRKLNEQN
ncbi:MAG TPA: nickel pincer cofactor biosynthesis protein LarC [Pyrinomonadaceae bacterium]|nr:nickel pincer cofactor biosynthesis protein LarC [Pyrinomonadaceae bacterium]